MIEIYSRFLQSVIDYRSWFNKNWKSTTVAEAISVSRLANVPKREVAMTPWFKNLLVKDGDLRDEKGGGEKRLLTTETSASKAEDHINDFTSEVLRTYQSDGISKEYDQWNMLGMHNYNVDCWRNFKNSLRQAVPSDIQHELLFDAVRGFERKTVVNDEFLHLLIRDEKFQKVIEFVLADMPQFTSSDDITGINSYFLSKHTNVGAPFYRNDQSVDKMSGKKYGELAMLEASKVHNVYDLEPVAVLFSRLQNLKVRPIIGTSRVANLFFNRVLSQCLPSYASRARIFIGYSEPDATSKALTQLGLIARNRGYLLVNRDYAHADLGFSINLKILAFAMLAVKCRDTTGVDILEAAACYYSIHRLATPKGMTTIYGNILSGELWTNFIENIINAIQSIDNMYYQDSEYLDLIAKYWEYSPVRCMGDDNLLIQRSGRINDSVYVDRMKSRFGSVIHPLAQKGEIGAFFLQQRACYDGYGNLVTMTPWTRVIRSLTIRERPVGLGQFGWMMMFYQQLERLRNIPAPILKSIVHLFYQMDKHGLCVELDDQQFMEGLRNEDALNASDPSWDKLYDGRPSRIYQLGAGHVGWSSKWIHEQRNLLKCLLRNASTHYVKYKL